MNASAQIVEMDQERDRKTCLSLDLKVTGSNRELAQWCLNSSRSEELEGIAHKDIHEASTRTRPAAFTYAPDLCTEKVPVPQRSPFCAYFKINAQGGRVNGGHRWLMKRILPGFGVGAMATAVAIMTVGAPTMRH